MNHGALAVFSNIETSSYETLKSFASFHEIPFITMTHPIHEYNYMSSSSPYDSNHEEDDRSSRGGSSSMDSSLSNFDAFDDVFDEKRASWQQRTKTEDDSMIIDSKDKLSSSSLPRESFLLNMHPDLVPLIVSMIKYNRWKNIYYIYDHEEGIYLFFLKAFCC